MWPLYGTMRRVETVSDVTAMLDFEVRRSIYAHIFMRGWVPLLIDVATSLERPISVIREAYGRLAAAHTIVLQRESDEILMANPFSAVPTPFQVEVGGQTFWGNCIWDALGIGAMIKTDAEVSTSCGDCGSALQVRTRAGMLAGGTGVAHFAVPARDWWSDIVFT